MAEHLSYIHNDLVWIKDLVSTRFEYLTKRLDDLDEKVGQLRVDLDETRSAGGALAKAEALPRDSADRVDGLEGRLKRLEATCEGKLQKLTGAVELIESLHDTITETVVNSQRSKGLERLHEQLGKLNTVKEQLPPDAPVEVEEDEGKPDGKNAGPEKPPQFTRRQGRWVKLKLGGRVGHEGGICCRRRPQAGATKPEDALNQLKLQPLMEMRKGRDSPKEILQSVLDIESICTTPMSHKDSGFTVECLVDEPTITYCTCSSTESQTVISYLRLRFDKTTVQQALDAICCETQRSKWDGDSEFRVIKPAEEGDVYCEEVVHHVLHAPWPFWDRDVLQHRWRLPVPNGKGGTALVMRSASDELLAPQAGRIRATVHKAAYIFRDLHGGKGLELISCSQLDIGGLVPQWAQDFLGRFASRRAEAWQASLLKHCEEHSALE